jgi:hypothetical protein
MKNYKLIRLGIIIIGLAITLLLAVKAYKRIPSFNEQVDMYTGDGTIKNISFDHMNWTIDGYSIEFENFPLNERYIREFTLSDLPRHPATPYVYFRMYDVSDKEDVGVISLFVKDGDGNTFVSLEQRQLNTLIWTRTSWTNWYDAYDLDASKFKVKRNTTYSLTVDYTPTSDQVVSMGSIYIRCGGSL